MLATKIFLPTKTTMTTTELPRVIALLARQLHIERLHRLAAKFETGITAATLSDQAVTLGDPTAKQLRHLEALIIKRIVTPI